MSELRALDACTLLEVFVGARSVAPPPGLIYALGTRENPNLIKVGMTTRDPVVRVNEINRATGVVIPFGVRGTWAVTQPKAAETAAHEELDSYRVRADREFFNLPFGTAKSLITRAVKPFRVAVKLVADPNSPSGINL
ncbi:GIY-YIG nuclease family protein [Maricaulis sp.]|uniref:GIY-YIG nuclease family protein n=1 Tax=Maricaulis sp. TaxID=1486257 RepID=UPI003A8D0143